MADPALSVAVGDSTDEDEDLVVVEEEDEEAQEEEEDLEEEEEDVDEEEYEDEIPWRLRRAADDILEGRLSGKSTKAPWKRFTNETFQVHQGTWAIHQAFEFAALSILNAMRQSALQEDEDEEPEDEEDEDWKDQLPKSEHSADRITAFQQVWENSQSTKPVRKFTRNTPASSAASLDARFQGSRAMLCGAANFAFSQLTPGPSLPVLQDITVSAAGVNLGAVALEAQTAGERTVALAQNAMRRSDQRYAYRKRCADGLWKQNAMRNLLFSKNQRSEDDDDTSDDEEHDLGLVYEYDPDLDASTHMWQSMAIPRFLKVLQTGVGHAIYHDVQWSTRHGRIAELLQQFDSYGPHLILTTQIDLMKFAKQFRVRSWWNADDEAELSVLPYFGSAAQRRELRRDFAYANGLPGSPFHVVVASYKTFFEDYGHFTALPWDIVVVDDGVAWIEAGKDADLGKLFDDALFSASDHHVGLAGTTYKKWDFTKDVKQQVQQDPWVGLTARHRVLTASAFHNFRPVRNTNEIVQVVGLLEFLVPHFVSTVKEEWDRSKITIDSGSMNHFRKLIARSVVVHHEDAVDTEENTLVLQALTGKLPSVDRSGDPKLPNPMSDEDFVSAKKVQFSRRTNLQWFGPSPWLGYELGKANFEPIFELMKRSNNRLTCEEVTTASSTTSSGATGQVAGTMAFRLAVRCGRHFGSEPGLRQHVNAHHAPAGTWLCRACSVDCISSQARTHHERSCGQPASVESGNAGVGATPTVGQGGTKKPAKKKTKTGGQAEVEKDEDGSIKVPGYRGVWVNKSGKHFVKLDGQERLNGDDEKLLLFATADEAAKKHDEFAKAKSESGKAELNFEDDGSRIVYGDITPASTSGLGGSAANVVPALSKINIKDLPSDVKPLLRDPRQTSRTGGNSKRHVYAYRGVCRQKRKGHDRWQSQISFMGTNHYLGTFDSEWDAAAIYAWAHLILYGPEATRQAQKEGEEAAAAYEQEKKDLAAGKIPEPPPKPEKKKKPAPKKKKSETDTKTEPGSESATKKRKPKDSVGPEKKRAKVPKTEKDALPPMHGRGVQKVPVFARKDTFKSTSDVDLLQTASARAKLSMDAAYSSAPSTLADIDDRIRPCIPGKIGIGRARFVGLSPAQYSWDVEEFCSSQELEDEEAVTAIRLLAIEYDKDGVNEQFATILQGTCCTIGRAGTKTQKQYESLGLGTVPLGGSVGRIDCHIGGLQGSSAECAACIFFDPLSNEFRLSTESESDFVTLNGYEVQPDQGSKPLRNGDVCSVGARVFAFLLS